jgi:hypothetical protein
LTKHSQANEDIGVPGLQKEARARKEEIEEMGGKLAVLAQRIFENERNGRV